MNVLIIAPTGVRIKAALKNLQSFYRTKKGYPDEAKLMQHSFAYYVLEEEIAKSVAFPAYLDSDDYRYQEQLWQDALERIKSAIEKANHDNAFLCINYPYFRDDRFFPAIDLNSIREFEPDIIITFIEDSYATWKRIQIREQQYGTRSIFRLRDMFTWRTTSILLADIIAKNTDKTNYVVPVKHPAIMLYRLIFELTSTPLVYASFPITYTRDNPDRRAEIDHFRKKLNEEFCVFDPLTVDDRVLQLTYSKNKDRDTIPIRKVDRWPIPADYSLVDDIDVWGNEESFTIPRSQVEEVVLPTAGTEKTVIDKHIAYRDFRSISKADVVVAYRPYFEKHFAKGVFAEILYANQTARKPCYFCWNNEDGSPSESPFMGKGKIYYTIVDIIHQIRDNKDALIKRN